MSPGKINRITLLLVLVGFGSALLIYLTSSPKPKDLLAGDPFDTKKFRREMEYYGGKANVLSSEFMDWFRGLWHGRPLAFTVATLTASGILVFRLVASVPPEVADQSSEQRTGPRDRRER